MDFKADFITSADQDSTPSPEPSDTTSGGRYGPENRDQLASGSSNLASPGREINGAKAALRRAKSSLRLKYEAETQVIERKLGDLESIREKLGLSQRKIAQLLLVDPSAWTRWTKNPNGERDLAPPHIYRMLQWYLALEGKYPALDVNFWLNTVAQPRDVTGQALLMTNEKTAKLAVELAEARERIHSLEKQQANVHLKPGAVNEALYGSKRAFFGAWMLAAIFTAGLAVGAVAILLVSR